MGSIELGSIATRFSHEEKQIRSDRSLLAWKSFLLVRFITSKAPTPTQPILGRLLVDTLAYHAYHIRTS